MFPCIRRLAFLALVTVVAACMERQPSEFASPVLGEVKVEVGFDAVHFDVQVRGAWSECGVYFGESASALRRIPGERTGLGFSVDIPDLSDETEYYWKAFVGNGHDEVLSGQERVVTQVSPYIKIPDPAFRAWVLAHHDVDGDGRISEQEARLIVAILNREGIGVRSLRGIECFPNLKSLIWTNDKLLEVDLSGNDRLEEINLEDNLLAELDLSGCPRLEYLSCNDNKLSELDLSPCPRLKQVSCWNNLLTALDVSGLPELEILCCAQSDFSDSGLDVSANPKLRLLWCNDTRLKELVVSSNPLLEELGCYGNSLFLDLDLTANPLLDTLQVADNPDLKAVWLKTGQVVRRGIVKDDHTALRYADSTPPVPIPDPGFKAYLAAFFDSDADGEISRSEARRIRRIDACPDEWNIRSLQGIEYMPELTAIQCVGSWIDGPVPEQPYYFQGPYRWDGIFGPAGTLREVDVSHNPNLVELSLNNNAGLGLSIGTIDLHANPLLEVLELGMTYLEYPDVSFLTELRTLDLGHLYGNKPDISSLNKLRRFVLDFPQDDRTGYAVDVSHCPELEVLIIPTAGSVSDLSKNPELRDLRVGYMGLPVLDITALHRLEYLDCVGNRLTELDLSGNPGLRDLKCQGNWLTTLDVSENPVLERLWASPMSNDAGENLLETLYVAAGQVIPSVTENRSEEHIPAQTKIVTK